MTVKEIEVLSGMTRANIRFYESEGLLAPERGANGYRNYSEDDLQTLLRIRLLRSLRMPLEEIKAIHAGDRSLTSAMNRHLDVLNREQQDIDRSRRVCREIVDQHADYRTLDAPRYLASLSSQMQPVPETDVMPPVRAPWRRWFARTFDMTLYGVLWNLFLMLVCNVNLTQRNALGNLLDSAAVIVMTIILEPLLLHFFGTTPGKWILGLSVADPDGGRLSISAARERTWGALWHGCGLSLPVYGLVREWKSHNACTAGEPLPWESDSMLALKDEKRRRYVVYAMVRLAVLGISLLGLSFAEMPMHRGDITPAEFSANFNRLADYYGMDFGAELDENGRWVKDPPTPGVVIIQIGGEVEQPDFTFTEQNGAITSVGFRYETRDNTIWAPSFQNQMTLAVLSYACAQEGFGYYSGARRELLQMLEENEFNSFTFANNGITVTCDVEYSGYMNVGFLLPDEGAETHYSRSFTITQDAK